MEASVNIEQLNLEPQMCEMHWHNKINSPTSIWIRPKTNGWLLSIVFALSILTCKFFRVAYTLFVNETKKQIYTSISVILNFKSAIVPSSNSSSIAIW